MLIYSDTKPEPVISKQVLLQNTTWYVEEYSKLTSEGYIEPHWLLPDTEPSIHLDASGNILLNIDCNTTSAAYTSTENRLDIDLSLASTTLAACSHYLFEYYQQQNSQLRSFLEGESSYQVEEGRLRLTNALGDFIVFTDEAPRKDDEIILTNSHWKLDLLFTPENDIQAKGWLGYETFDHTSPQDHLSLDVELPCGDSLSGRVELNQHQVVFPDGITVMESGNCDAIIITELSQALQELSIYTIDHQAEGEMQLNLLAEGRSLIFKPVPVMFNAN